MKRSLITLLLAAVAAAGASVDGKWKIAPSEMSKPRTSKKGVAVQTPEMTLDLKSSGAQLTGTITSSASKKGRGLQVSDGKIDGDSFTFTTVQKTKKGEAKMNWRGTVKGDQITGTRTKEGGRKGQPFTAKKAG